MPHLIDRDVPAGSDDAKAIAQLHAAFDIQRRAFAAQPCPSLQERQAHLMALASMVLSHRDRILEALRTDFATHPTTFGDLSEILGVAQRAAYAAKNLPVWMADEPREIDGEMGGNGRAFVRYQPKGVIGNIAPWNFPFDIGFGPIADMLAAGNRVILKPSDLGPACAEVAAEMVAKAFNPDVVTVVTGGIDLARTFPTLPFNHLMYTGSAAVGREVMRAAATNLTPVTLELGGKCPAIITSGGLTSQAVDDILGVKRIKNGQMCVSVDYVLTPRDKIEEFVALAKSSMAAHAPGYNASSEQTGIITKRHYERLLAMLEEARESGSQVIKLDAGATADARERRLPLHLVVNPASGLRIMQEEIFGPILPIVAYDSLDDAIAFVNDGERPLGLYIFGTERGEQDRILAATTSGGVAINSAMTQAAIPSLGFGGIGASGMGRHHGKDGFREFSNPRGFFVRGTDPDFLSLVYPPATPEAQGAVANIYEQAAGG